MSTLTTAPQTLVVKPRARYLLVPSAMTGSRILLIFSSLFSSLPFFFPPHTSPLHSWLYLSAYLVSASDMRCLTGCMETARAFSCQRESQTPPLLFLYVHTDTCVILFFNLSISNYRYTRPLGHTNNGGGAGSGSFFSVSSILGFLAVGIFVSPTFPSSAPNIATVTHWHICDK